MDETWAATKQFSAQDLPDHRLQEEAFWIMLDTRTEAYSFSQTQMGVPFTIQGPGSSGGGVDPGPKPATQPAQPAWGDGAIYAVATFHTHTPMTWGDEKWSRPVGQSPADVTSADLDHYNCVGFVYDYTSTIQNPNGPGFVIKGGLALDADAKVYPY